MRKELIDFEYVTLALKKPDGSLLHAFRIQDLPKGKKGVIGRFLEKEENKLNE